MADVKWIKISTDMLDNRKIKQIEVLPEGDAIIVVWVKLLCLAGNINDTGYIYFTNEIPYTEEMMATEFRRPINTIRLALNTFEKFGMIEIIDDIIKISNWEKYQNIDGMEKIREQTRNRVAKHRERKKMELLEAKEECNVTVTLCNGTDKIRIEEDKNRIDKEKDKRNNINYQEIVNMYNDICISFPKCTSLSQKRKDAIRARLKNYSVDDFRRLFEKAEASRFLKGGNDRNWSAKFDWLIKDSSMAKVLDGNYDDNKDFHNGSSSNQNNRVAQQLDDFYETASKWAEREN